VYTVYIVYIVYIVYTWYRRARRQAFKHPHTLTRIRTYAHAYTHAYTQAHTLHTNTRTHSLHIRSRHFHHYVPPMTSLYILPCARLLLLISCLQQQRGYQICARRQGFSKWTLQVKRRRSAGACVCECVCVCVCVCACEMCLCRTALFYSVQKNVIVVTKKEYDACCSVLLFGVNCLPLNGSCDWKGVQHLLLGTPFWRQIVIEGKL